jgi:hypothetical protein
VALISDEFWLLGLKLGDIKPGKGILTVNKIIAIVRGTLTTENLFEFSAGGLPPDMQPILNFALTDMPFTERLDMYFDVGATDPNKDLDDLNADTMPVIYLDPAYIVGEGHDTAGTLPPKALLMRCLSGSGLVYLNCGASIGYHTRFNAPFALNGEGGMFYYTFPRDVAHRSKGSGDERVSVHLASIHLRTFEEANRFQLIVFR